jgi:hypothetical protein
MATLYYSVLQEPPSVNLLREPKDIERRGELFGGHPNIAAQER